MSKPSIKPQLLKGFRDYLPSAMIAREHLIDIAKTVYRSYGFAPIDTPALEYSEILLGKGGDESDKQMFRFTDQGDRDVAMRFDLTVPLARYCAQHLHEIGLPFKRYHIGTVWRAEKPQKGRYREFMQCDFDTLGTNSNVADMETLFVINDLLEAIGFERFQIRVNNRKVLNGLLESLGLEERAPLVLRSLDKLAKIQAEGVKRELVEIVGLTDDQADRLLELSQLSGTPEEILARLDELLSGNDTGQLGVAALREIFEAVSRSGLPDDRVMLDVSIARGLDYYTGTIYETFLLDRPTFGSVCSGGRYDNLTGMFLSNPVPGVGASLGLDRMLAAMEDLGIVESTATTAEVLVTILDENHIHDYVRVARLLRRSGLNVDLYPEPRPLGKQLKFADQKGFRFVVIAGDTEFAECVWQLKDMQSGDRLNVDEAELAPLIASRTLAEA